MNVNFFSVTLVVVLLGGNLLKAQTVIDNDVESIKHTNVRTYLSFYIPPNELQDFSYDLTVQATYTPSKNLQIRGGVAFGTFTGFKGGVSYLPIVKEVTAKPKFVTSRVRSGRNTETVTYYRLPSRGINYAGFALDAQVGKLSKSGFYLKTDIGVEMQWDRKAFMSYNNRRIAGQTNGWISLKAQAVVLNSIYGSDIYQLTDRRFALGAQLVPAAILSPWKRVTMYTALPFGYAQYLGSTLEYQGFTLDKLDKGIYIFSIDLGVSINLR